jgi:hypothetical protein
VSAEGRRAAAHRRSVDVWVPSGAGASAAVAAPADVVPFRRRDARSVRAG